MCLHDHWTIILILLFNYCFIYICFSYLAIFTDHLNCESYLTSLPNNKYWLDQIAITVMSRAPNLKLSIFVYAKGAEYDTLIYDKSSWMRRRQEFVLATFPSWIMSQLCPEVTIKFPMKPQILKDRHSECLFNLL